LQENLGGEMREKNRNRFPKRAKGVIYTDLRFDEIAYFFNEF
jgi:hypothetical protein